MFRHRGVGAAGVIVLVLLAAACSSSSGKSERSTTTTSGTGATAGPGGSTPGVTVTLPSGTPVTLPDGTPATVPAGVTVVTRPNGTPVTNPGGSLVTTPATTPSGGTTAPAPMRWKLALDFRTHPDKNPFASYSGGAPVWTLMQSASLQPGNYTKLGAYAPSYAAGLAAWHGTNQACGGLPAVGVAILGPARVCNNATVNPQVAFLIPDASHLAVVAWKSPVTSNIAISAGLAELANPACGDGVAYTIDRDTTTLTQGTLPTGGSKELAVVRTHVSAGQTVYFTVGPGASGNADCDATQLAVTIDTV